MGELRSLFSFPVGSSHCLGWLGQACQGLELEQLQAAKQLDWTHWLLEHGLCQSRWFLGRFGWQGQYRHVVGLERRQAFVFVGCR